MAQAALRRAASQRDGDAARVVRALLTDGGDERIALDPATGANKYGCPPDPVRFAADFASSTASVISARGLRAAVGAQAAFARTLARLSDPGEAYARRMDRVRSALLGLNGLGPSSGVEIAFAASGTDLHLQMADLLGGERGRPAVRLGVEAAETGSGVPDALAGRHFAGATAQGASVRPGEAVSPGAGSFVPIAIRNADGGLRDGADIECELDAAALEAARSGRKALVVVADVSKTGLIAPGLQAVTALKRRFPQTVEVLVDACQFRLAPSTLQRYLAHGFAVLVTGSKFLTGPAFSGAVFLPRELAARLQNRIPAAELGQYSAAGDWPDGFAARSVLPRRANPGLLLRWRAALSELAAFRTLPDGAVSGFAGAFADLVETRIATDPALELLPARPLDRSAIGAPAAWDLTPTLFAFRLRDRAGELLAPGRVRAVHAVLASEGVRLGQPVEAGRAGETRQLALRLSLSARNLVDALSAKGDGPEGVLGQAMTALERASALAAG